MNRREVLRSVMPAAASVIGGFGLAACREEPIRQSYSVPFNGYGTLQDRAAQIRRAAAERGWVTRIVASPGAGGGIGNTALGSAGVGRRSVPVIEAVNNRDGHNVVVHITYDQNSFSIRYVSSTGLNYDGQRIHTYYNRQVQQLEQQIQRTSV